MEKTIALVGNPNVGKSVVFSRLTGTYAVVSNYPGTTVDISRGTAVFGGRKFQVIDTPGTNSLEPVSEDEQVTRDILKSEHPDVIVQVADAKNMYRTLLLTFELQALGLPLILELNMFDELLQRGMKIDRDELEKLLGIPVVESTAISGEGIAELKRHIRALTDSGAAREALVPPPVTSEEKHTKAREITLRVLRASSRKETTRLEKLGAAMMHPVGGYVFVAVVLFILYEFVGVFAAGTVVDFLEHTVFGAWVTPVVSSAIDHLTTSVLVKDFLIGKYGIISMAISYAFAIVLPIVTAFFLFFSILEDTGYLPRLSVMLDRLFRIFGLNGKAVLPMVLGLGCGTMAALSTRILETRKERIITVILLSLTIPCSAQIGVILGLLSGVSWKIAVVWIASISLSIVMVGSLANKLVPGEQSPFIFEIPPVRVPSVVNILRKVGMRLRWYLKEAVPLFVLGTVLLFIVDKLAVLTVIERMARPIVVSVLGLPPVTTAAFLIGFLRRDYGAAGLYVLAKQGLLDPTQVLVSVVAITLFVPCIAQCFMVVKEQGWKLAMLIFAGVTLYAVTFAGIVNVIARSIQW
ncbi:MAG: ferrous iron transporter B [Elusimicrobia bacterium]|nr:ferrous iron transporter B [Elusimicrobiota bacterium]